MKTIKLIETITLPGAAPNGLADGFYYFDEKVYRSLGGVAWLVMLPPEHIIDTYGEPSHNESVYNELGHLDTVSESFALKAMAMCLKPSETLKVLNK